MKKAASLLTLALLLLQSFASYAALEFIPLSHRSPTDIVESVRPFLKDGETVIAGHNEIIVRASTENMSDIVQLVKRLDKAAHRLLILVKRDGQMSASDKGYSTHGHASIGIGSGTKSQLQGSVRVYDTNISSSDKNAQKINVLDGYPAYISQGTSEPLSVVQVHQYGKHQHMVTGTEYHDATTGFYVTPRLSRDSVTLEISPWSKKPLSSKASAEISYSSTVIRGRLNEWISLSNVDEANSTTRTDILERRYQVKKSVQGVWVKVIDLDQQ